MDERRIGQRHRMSIGTIVSEASMLVKLMNGRSLGTIEESFISRLRKGDAFLFGGRMLELVRVHEMTAYVKPAKRGSGAVPRWMGTKMPLSTELADAVLRRFEEAVAGRYDGPEMRLARPLIELQARWSAVPTRSALVVESMLSREGRHLFVGKTPQPKAHRLEVDHEPHREKVEHRRNQRREGDGSVGDARDVGHDEDRRPHDRGMKAPPVEAVASTAPAK